METFFCLQPSTRLSQRLKTSPEVELMETGAATGGGGGTGVPQNFSGS